MIRKRLLHGGLWAIFGRGLGVLSGLAVNALLARLLPPDEMGAYFLTVSVVVFVSMISQFGMPTAAVRFIAESMGRNRPGRVRETILRAIMVYIVVGGGIAVAYVSGIGNWVASVLFHSNAMLHATPWIALLALILGLQGLLAEIFRGFHDLRLASLLGGVSTSVFSASAFFVVWILVGHADFQLALKLSAGAALSSVVVSVALLSPRVRRLRGEGSIGVSELLQTGWPLCVSSLAIFAAVQGDLWVVGALLTDRDAAVYGAALRLLAMMTMMHGLAVSVVQSTVAELYGQGRMDELQVVIQRAAFLACLVAAVVLVCLALFGREILNAVFGSFYVTGYWPLMMLAAGQFVGMLFGPTEIVMMMSGYQRATMWIILLNTALGLILAVFLAPRMGLAGVAGSWAGIALLEGFVSWWYVKKNLSVDCHAKWIRRAYAQQGVE